jgi:hypothetical protein
VRGEKEVCHFFVRLAEEAGAVLAMRSWPEASALINKAYGGTSDLDKYVRNVAGPLVKRRYDLAAVAGVGEGEGKEG